MSLTALVFVKKKAREREKTSNEDILMTTKSEKWASAGYIMRRAENVPDGQPYQSSKNSNQGTLREVMVDRGRGGKTKVGSFSKAGWSSLLSEERSRE